MNLKELRKEIERLQKLAPNNMGAIHRICAIKQTVEAVDICFSDGYGLNLKLNPYYKEWQKTKELLRD